MGAEGSWVETERLSVEVARRTMVEEVATILRDINIKLEFSDLHSWSEIEPASDVANIYVRQ